MWFRRQQAPLDRYWADGETWDSKADWERACTTAVPVTGADIRLIDTLVRHLEDAIRRAGPSSAGIAYAVPELDPRTRWKQLVQDLYERAGAASVICEDPRAVPLTLAEIRQVRQVRDKIHDLAFDGYYKPARRDPVIDQADDLLRRLAYLTGKARARGEAGGVAVFRDNRPPGQNPHPALRTGTALDGPGT